jgi:hypothetical protein
VTTEQKITIRSGISNVSACPLCEAVLDAWTGVHVGAQEESPTPESGDPTVCGSCGALLIFADYHGRVRLPTETERAEMEANEAMWPILVKIVNFVREKKAAL